MASHRPRNVEKITEDASKYDYDARVPIERWLRTAKHMLRQAGVYEREGNDESTYLLLFRHAHLVLTNLPVHPEAKQPRNARALEDATKEVNRNLERMEVLKPRINRRYERYKEIQAEREARRSLQQADGRRRSSSPQLDTVQTLEPREHGDIALKLAQKEAHRRAQRRRSGPYTPEDEAIRRGGGVWGQWSGPAYDASVDGEDDLQHRLQEVRARVDGQHVPEPSHQARQQSNYSYPSVPSKSGLDHAFESSTTPPLQAHSASISPPLLPPKHLLHQEHPPALPAKSPFASSTSHTPPKTTSTPPPVASSYTFSAAAATESGSPLRTLFLPPTLRKRFLSIAQPNTRRNLETCGILAGSLISNALFISHLVIPSQNSTPDTCEMEDESALFDYVDQQDLMVFGWIHTHPTQTCFMSSRDLHTQSGYQVMLPESIAIVCAPSQHTQHHENGDGGGGGDWGCFRLTDPPGLKTILACRKEGLFHPHETNDIYTGALRPGHVVEAEGLGFQVVDLRGK